MWQAVALIMLLAGQRVPKHPNWNALADCRQCIVYSDHYDGENRTPTAPPPALFLSGGSHLGTVQLKAATTPGSVTLYWSQSVAGASCTPPASITYNIYQGLAPGTEGSTPINPAPIAALTYTTTSVTPGTTYYWTMIASELCGAVTIPGAMSNEVSETIPTTAAPYPPTNPAGTTSAPAAVLLSWTCSPSALQGPVFAGQVYYNVYRNGTVINPSPVYCNELLCHYYDNKGLVTGTYAYQVTAWTPTGGESGYSKSVSVVIP